MRNIGRQEGIATAVGMAMGARRERGLLDPDTPAGASPFDHRIFVLCSDGDIQEGISAEASAFAGHQQLGNLVMV
jgi:transketolase